MVGSPRPRSRPRASCLHCRMQAGQPQSPLSAALLGELGLDPSNLLFSIEVGVARSTVSGRGGQRSAAASSGSLQTRGRGTWVWAASHAAALSGSATVPFFLGSWTPAEGLLTLEPYRSKQVLKYSLWPEVSQVLTVAVGTMGSDCKFRSWTPETGPAQHGAWAS